MSIFLPVLRRSSWLPRPETSLADRFFEGLGLPELFEESKGWIPAFDVSETEDSIVVRAEVPGMDKKDIDVTLTEGILTVKGEKKQETKEEKEDYHLIERRYGSFSRSMRVHTDVEIDKVDATYKDGVLKITLPKADPGEKTKKIEVAS